MKKTTAKKSEPKKAKMTATKTAHSKDKALKSDKNSAKAAPQLAKAGGKASAKPIGKPAGKADPKAGQKPAINPAELSPEAVLAAAAAEETEVVLTNADGQQYCRMPECDNAATSNGLCRLHYISQWKRNKVKGKILEGGKLDKYIEDLTSKYPDKYLEMLRKDLASEKDFNLIVTEMDMEASGDDAEADDEASRLIAEVRGGVPTSSDDNRGGF